MVNLEYLGRVVFCTNGILYPDSVVGTDSHTTMIAGLGVAGWGVGGIESEATMLGQVQKKMQPLLLQNLLLLVIVTAMSEIFWRDAKYGPGIKELSFFKFFHFLIYVSTVKFFFYLIPLYILLNI
ncbi:hypothetical protein ACSBR2_011802 [Camellia fascicularis]